MLNRTSEALLEPSDEEVLVASEADSESEVGLEDTEDVAGSSKERFSLAKPEKRPSDSNSEVSASPEPDEDDGGWGTLRKDYYNADNIETEADALEEEAEARRLQQKRLQGMTEADFGFDEADWLEAGKDGDDEAEDISGRGRARVIREVLPKLEITDAMGSEERLKIMRTRYPEFEPLAKEFLNLQSMYGDLETSAARASIIPGQEVAALNGNTGIQDTKPSITGVRHQALSAYLAALAMYFALLTAGASAPDGKSTAMPPEQLRDHTIMETLVQCRDLWERVKNMAVIDATEVCVGGDLSINGYEEQMITVNEEDKEVNTRIEGSAKPRVHKRSKAQKAAEAAQAEAQARRAEKIRETEASLADLSVLTKFTPSAKRINSSQIPTSTQINFDSDSDFGEQTSLTPLEAAEKAKQNKSLKFYTSQIAQKANKRDAGGRYAGGDADIPYRERLKDRQARLNAEAEKRGKKPEDSSKGAPLGGSSDEDDHAVAKESRDAEGSEEDYYDLVASRSAAKKASKAALAAAHAQAEKEGGIVRIVENDSVGADGKRAITYAIEKNKGLAPKRKKDVRNPRVKKRKKYEDKMKKLSSIRPVYKGGEGRGGYGGEKTGIKKGLVKSIKL